MLLKYEGFLCYLSYALAGRRVHHRIVEDVDDVMVPHFDVHRFFPKSRSLDAG